MTQVRYFLLFQLTRFLSTTLAQEAPSPTASVDEAFCDFGPLPVQSLCEWRDGCGGLSWAPGTGLQSNWLGGPAVDSTAGSMEGGYAFLECSQPGGRPGDAGLLRSPQLGGTTNMGTCLMFKYAIDGLSPASLRLLMINSNLDELAAARNATCNATRPVTHLEDGAHVVWHADYRPGLGLWQQAQLLYTFPGIHSLIFEGLPVETTDPLRAYRGFLALDDIDLQPGTSCVGFCSFAGGLCDWQNELEDDFDWGVARGSADPTTGPAADRGATDGYAFISSRFPRRPGDAARLASVGLPASGPDAAQCLRFSFHMFGPGVGQLSVSVRQARGLEPRLQEIWRLRGNAGNSWFDSRVTIASLQDFQLVFEATVGNTAMGDIAIDEVSFASGPCPTSPQVAAPSQFPRDCAFEVDECDWLNVGREQPVAVSSPASWERLSQQTLSPRNRRKPYTQPVTRPRQEFFMGLQARAGAPGATGYLVGNEIEPSDEPLCLTFWYLMFESFIDATGPSLGLLRVLVLPVNDTLEMALPVWQLYNNQGPTWNYAQANIDRREKCKVVFEGTWGPNRANGNIAIDDIAFYTGNCSVRPNSASVRVEDCSFEKGLCGWENVTSKGVNDPRVQWQRAFSSHRPAQLLDKTFGSAGDFIFFDIFSPNQKRQVKLRSPLINFPLDQDSTCFTFWFVAFGVEESTSLRVLKMSVNEETTGSVEASQEQESEQSEQVLWASTARGFNNPRPSWTWAQVTIENRGPYRLILEGSASNGGFAIDDIKFLPQACPTRPVAARPSATSLEL